SWELRAVTSMSRLLRRQGNFGKDREEPIHDLRGSPLSIPGGALSEGRIRLQTSTYPGDCLPLPACGANSARPRRDCACDRGAQSGKLGERAALIAYHWEQAGDAREAAKWHRRAAEWVGLNNSAEALRHWGSVRQLLDTLPETPENLAARAAVRAQIMNPLARMGDLEDQATSLFQEGRELATRSGDRHVLSQVLNGFGQLRLFAG